MLFGIDLGTSSLKTVLVEDDTVVAEASAPLTVERPHPMWAEQEPEAWWTALGRALAELRTRAGPQLAAVQAIGLSGQMHGAVLLDGADRPLRPAILWNDGRSGAQCAELKRRAPALEQVTGNLAMPGFTAPKLLWVAEHEPEVFARTRRVLLPKDYLRLRLTGEAATDMSDAAGTLWLDVGARRWSENMLEATSLTRAHVPALFEGSQFAGVVSASAAAELGLPRVPVTAGASDNAAAALGAGAFDGRRGVVSLGTSGTYVLPSARFEPDTSRAVHTFCHALPGTWLRMAVTLSAASALDWASGVLGATVPELLVEAERAAPASERGLFFLPYLSGERTPHNDPKATASWTGLRAAHTRGDLARAVLEGVALSIADAAEPFAEAPAHELLLLGGGGRSRFWAQLLTDALARPLSRIDGASAGAALGAARLAAFALTGDGPASKFHPPLTREHLSPCGALRSGLPEYRRAYAWRMRSGGQKAGETGGGRPRLR